MFAGAVPVGGVLSSTVMVCEVEDVLLHASVNVQVLVIFNEFGQLPWTIVSIPCTVISPLQLSIAVSDFIAGTSTAHETVTDAGASGAIGLVLSCTLNVAEVEAVLPQESFAVKITVTAVEQSFESALKLLDHVTLEQVSDATAPPLLANQSPIEFWFPSPSHSTVIFKASIVKVGGVLSSIVIVWILSSALFPQLSVKLQVLAMVNPPWQPKIATGCASA